MKSRLLSNLDIADIVREHDKTTITALAKQFDVSVKTIRRVINGDITEGYDEPENYSLYYTKLFKQNQRRADALNVQRKQLRENARAENVLEELTKELIDVFSNQSVSNLTKRHIRKSNNTNVGVIQISDLHFGEKIQEVLDNKYDIDVLSARLKKLADKAIGYFKGNGVTDVLIASTGDMVNSDRRLDEITSNADNRSKVLFMAVDILQQFILHINEHFNVSYASICGNESRLTKDIGWVDFIASDSFDFTIHKVLERLFEKSKGVRILPITDPLESVIDVNGSNFLLIHGHNGTAKTAKAEMEVAKLKSKYSSRNVRIDYVIFGHIHCTYISDYFARSSGMPGGNAYSDKALNLTSKSAQNLYLVSSDGSIDAIRVDLQQYDENNKYTYKEDCNVYKPSSTGNNTVTIQSVLI